MISNPHQEGPVSCFERGPDPFFAQFPFEGLNKCNEVQVQTANIRNSFHGEAFAVPIARQEMGKADRAGKSLLIHFDARHEIKTYQDQIGDILSGEGLSFKMGMNTAQTPETADSDPVGIQLRNPDPSVVPDQDIAYITFSIYEKTDLTLDFPGNC